jgi:hypothetical protein
MMTTAASQLTKVKMEGVLQQASTPFATPRTYSELDNK